MLVIGRITKDAVVNVLKDEREVVNFSIAINDFYKPKGAAEATKVTTFINCAYWISSKIAERLTKGALVEITGRLFVTAYTDTSGNAKASLNCHANNIKIHSTTSKEAEIIGTTVSANSNDDKVDDLPF